MAPAVAAGGAGPAAESSAPPLGQSATARRLRLQREYEEMKRQSLVDAAATGVLGAVLGFLSNGVDTASGIVLGSMAASAYLALLHRDVDEAGKNGTPLDTIRPLRIVRLLIPLFLVFGLALQSAIDVGFDAWIANVRWEEGKNFVNFVGSSSTLYGALLGYVCSTLSFRLRSLTTAVPEVRDVVQALPGSVGVALKLADDEERKKKEKQTQAAAVPARGIPVFLVSGPRGCGKTTLVRELLKRDKRFREPQWVTTAVDDSVAEGKRYIDEGAFEQLEETGSLAVSYRPYGDDGDQVCLGLPAASVVQTAAAAAAAAEAGEGACILDVDPATARSLLQYNWDRALARMYPEERLEAGGAGVELQFVAVWVSLRTLDDIIERNRERLRQIDDIDSWVEKQLPPLRAQATSDLEWALTSGCFEFTILNEDKEASSKELEKAAAYCFGDPF